MFLAVTDFQNSMLVYKQFCTSVEFGFVFFLQKAESEINSCQRACIITSFLIAEMFAELT